MTLQRILLLLIFSATVLVAQPRVDIRDTTLFRGKISSVPVIASLSVLNGDTVRFIFNYQRSLLDITDVSILSSDISWSSIKEVPLSGDFAECTISFVTSGATYIGKKVLTVLMEPLAGPDSITKIKFTRILIGNKLIDTFKGDSSKISIYNSAPIEPIEGEYLSPPFPNYCTSSTTVEYRLLDSSDVVFDLFNLDGVAVQTTVVQSQPPGKHLYTFMFDTWSVSSGLYHIRMRSKRGVFVQQCLVVK